MSPHIRQCLAEVFVGLVVCFAAAELLLAPARKQLREAQASVASLLPAAVTSNAPTPDDVSRLVQSNASLREEIDVRSAASRDEAALFSEVMAIAGRHRVQLDQFQPATGRLAQPTAQPASASTPASRDSVASYSISLNGAFPGVVRFLDELRASRVFVSTRTVRITPVESEANGLVRADIIADFFAFSTSGEAPTSDAPAQTEARP